jgi:hypothetical protein
MRVDLKDLKVEQRSWTEIQLTESADLEDETRQKRSRCFSIASALLAEPWWV